MHRKRRERQRVAIGVAVALAATVGAWRTCQAQQADSARATGDTLPVYRGPDIEVRVGRSETPLARLPFGVALADRAELQEAERSASLEEALRFVPGIFVQNRRNAALGDRVTARGVGARAQFGVRGVRVLADGIPLTLPDGQTTLTNLDLASAGRLEVIRGPASALYGNAAGGVLSYRTEHPPLTGSTVEPLVLGGTHGFLEGRVKAAGRAGGLGYVGSFGYSRTEGFREHSESEILRGNVVVSGPVGRGEIRGLLNLYRTPFAENPSSLSLEDATERPRLARDAVVEAGLGEEATQGQAGLALDLRLGSEGRLRATAWGLRRDLWNPIPGRVIEVDRWAGGVRSEFSGTFRSRGTEAGPGAALRWTGGVDVELQRDDRAESENLGVAEPGGEAREGERLLEQRERVLGFGPFLQLEAALGARWIALVAGRFDLYRFEAEDRLPADGDDSGDRTLSRVSPSLGVVFRAAPGIQLYGNLSTAFQTPTTSELSNRPDGVGGFNEVLEPERIWSVEVGGRGTVRAARLGYEASAFRASVEDALIPFEGETGEVFFRNAGRVERTGVEASLGWMASDAVKLRLAYTLQRLRFDTFVTEAGDFSGNDEPGVPTQWLTIGAVHTSPVGFRAEANLRWVDAYAVDDANTAFNPSWRVLDLRLSLDRRDRGWPVRLFLGIDNALDERYNASVVPNAFGGRYYEPAPGIELYGGAALPLGPGRIGS